MYCTSNVKFCTNYFHQHSIIFSLTTNLLQKIHQHIIVREMKRNSMLNQTSNQQITSKTGENFT